MQTLDINVLCQGFDPEFAFNSISLTMHVNQLNLNNNLYIFLRILLT